ncbi:MAG: hypothetical protein J2P36_37845, partial [Ktedonobacteraceae bacterium]|nr:hypothetical protein [Ktedonobacteraceae bacterium]
MDAHELKKAGDTPQPPDVHLLRVMGQQEAGGGNTLSGNPPEERYEEKLARFKEEVSIRLERGMDDKITTIPREPGEGPQGNDWAVGTCASASLALYVNAAHPEGPRRTADDVLEFARAAHFSRTERTLGNMLMAHRFLIIDDNAARLLHEKKADLTTHHLEELMLKKLPPHSEQMARSLSKQELIFMTRTDAQGLLEKDIGPEARERIQTGTSTITKVDVEELLQGGAFLLRGSSSSLEGKRLFFRPEERLG